VADVVDNARIATIIDTFSQIAIVQGVNHHQENTDEGMTKMNIEVVVVVEIGVPPLHYQHHVEDIMTIVILVVVVLVGTTTITIILDEGSNNSNVDTTTTTTTTIITEATMEVDKTEEDIAKEGPLLTKAIDETNKSLANLK